MKIPGRIFLISILLPVMSAATSWAPPYAYVIPAQNDTPYYFKMRPNGPGGLGVCYKIGEVDKKLWETDGWYSYSSNVHLYDSKHLVRMGGRPPQGGAAISFFVAGKQVKEYAVSDLIKDMSMLDFPDSAPRIPGRNRRDWLKKTIGFIQPADDVLFGIVTTEGIKYVFNADSGEIVSEKNVSQ